MRMGVPCFSALATYPGRNKVEVWWTELPLSARIFDDLILLILSGRPNAHCGRFAEPPSDGRNFVSEGNMFLYLELGTDQCVHPDKRKRG